ncbi:MAG: carbamoyltransferase HypF [Lachnospiraceae bacterium]|nr:carbamoyltransferase HypF [Lachnospiraceae bacterium]
MEQESSYYRLTVYGLVQGVGFRPFVLEFCRKLGIKGSVKNAGASAGIYVHTDKETAGALIRRLSCIKGNDPELCGARVDDVDVCEISKEDFEKEADPGKEFCIEKSGGGSERIRFIPPDMGICEDCRREMLDPSNRRYGHPFISCVSCGPRFSIMEDIPYDRENTSMKEFALCDECAAEYRSSGKRRHAQTVACNKCGPKLKAFIMGKDGKVIRAASGNEALKLTIDYIRDGRTAAVKNTGGYHFVFDALRQGASYRLREYKKRESKPFAVMFSEIGDIREYCHVSETEEKLLSSPERPIVLLKKNSKMKLAEGICDHSSRIGAMLPCDGIQILLLEDGIPLVMTSANRHGQPMESRDEEAVLFLKEGACDIVLANDRRIINPLDDAVCQVIETGYRQIVQVLRRARGQVPAPVTIGRKAEADIFAAGGDLKAVFSYARDDMAFPGGHFGDLMDTGSRKSRSLAAKTLERMLGLKPEVFAADRHPGYYSLQEIIQKDPLKVQHHYAHLLSVAAEHGLSGKFLGVSFDGTGYGDDGTVWGGEFLVLDPDDTGGYRRAGHFLDVRLLGGDSIAYDAEKAAMCYVYEAISRGLIEQEENPFRGEKCEAVFNAVSCGINIHRSSSAGRFFDACTALLGICKTNTYEGECPERLQARAEEAADRSGKPDDTGMCAPIIKESNMYIADTVDLFAQLIRLCGPDSDEGMIALRIHSAVADIVIRCLDMIGKETGIKRVLLGGGVFANALLIQMIMPALHEKGYEVYMNEKVPPGDGGLALGQIYAACEEK